MKKVLSILITSVLFATFIFAASYTNNEYQKKARLYTFQAQKAYDEGDYDTAVELTILAEENAEKSKAYIEMMIAKNDADKKIAIAQNRKAWAQKVRGDVNFPMAFNAGVKFLENSLVSYEKENYTEASKQAAEATETFGTIREITPLPQYYVVKPWVETKDCYWNISARPYVYNNPVLWENLYQANKKSMKNPENPDLIYPGMKMEIPSIAGEYREGTYSPKAEYNAFSANR